MKQKQNNPYIKYFFLLALSIIAPISFSEEPYEDQYWKILLHIDGAKSIIDDPKFFLSKSHTLKDEFQATYDAFKDTKLDENHAICRFPRRFSWILEKLNLDRKNFPKPKCNDLENHYKKLGATKIAIVFVSESSTRFESLMGHSFIKIEGIFFNQETHHSLSYLAIIDKTKSVSKQYLKTITDGTTGYYTLSPFQNSIDEYIGQEDRSLWSYNLKLTKKELQNFIEHIWEIKEINLNYNFITHNCGTAAIKLLSSAIPELESITKGTFSTPIDYIKRIIEKNYISDIELYPSNSHKEKIKATKTFKMPSEKHYSSKIQTAIVKDNFILNFYPIYNQIEDDSRGNIDEYELTLFDFGIAFNKNLILKNFNILNLKYLPSIDFNQLSYSLNLSVENASLDYTYHRLFLNLEFGVGLSKTLFKDNLLLYSLLSPTFETKENFAFVSHSGLIIKPYLPFKTHIFYKKYFDIGNTYRHYDEHFSISQSFYFSSHFALNTGFDLYNKDKTYKDSTIKFSYYF